MKEEKMKAKLGTVTIDIPYKGPGNVIKQNKVSFDVFSAEDHFKAVPLLNQEERRVANLPDELQFFYQDGKPVSQRGIRDGNFHAIIDIVSELQKLNLIPPGKSIK